VTTLAEQPTIELPTQRGPADDVYPDRPDPSDAAAEVWGLVERAQAGESEAFGLIYDRYVDTVFRFVYFRVGNRQLAEDLTSDTFLRALKRIGSFTWQGRDLGAWLITIARNLVADYFKSGRYRLEISCAWQDALDREDADRLAEPDRVAVASLVGEEVRAALRMLTPEQQEVIELRYLREFTIAETCAVMGKTEGAVKAMAYRAFQRLRVWLPEEFAC
jgi:RNA polymerase sigma-70 factor (ECF subfamily)